MLRKTIPERENLPSERQSYTTDLSAADKLCIAEAEAEFGPHIQKVVLVFGLCFII